MAEEGQNLVFESWLDQHKALIFKIVRAYGPTAMDREDLFQEIIIQVWRSIPSFRKESSVTTWLYRIALNTALKWVRKEHGRGSPDTLDDVQHVLQDSNAE